MNKVFIVSAGRTAIGKFGGALQGSSAAELGTVVAKEVISRSSKSAEQLAIDEVILGNVLGAGHGMNVARQVCIGSGLNVSTPAYTVNKVCGSGLKAVTLAAQSIAAGEAQAVLAGGSESMSQAPFVSLNARWGARLGHAEFKDLILQDGLTDVFGSCHMGITAENLSSKYSISREEQDAFAFESQQRAAKAQAEGKFKDEIVAVPLKVKGKDPVLFANDEYIRADTTKDSLAKLKPAFKSDGTVTAGNASGINDGAAVLLLASESHVKKLGLKPLAEVVGWASAGVEPQFMGIGPVYAVKRLLERTNTKLSDIDLIEANEAFAAQALAVNKLLEWDTSRVNVNGGAIALGHPIGASGARILVSLLFEMQRSNRSLGVATLCVGGGQGIAIMVKR